MTTVAEVAGIWNSAGVSCIPVKSNGTKQPAVRWATYQAQLPSIGELSQWWQNGKSSLGLALICGAVSGNLEMTELEASAAGGDSLIDIQNALDALGFGHVWEFLTTGHTYMEWTPSGGIHFLYRITDAPVPGNTKLAMDEGGKVLAETRGEGGYVIVAPTSGLVHPTGESWSLAAGQYGQLGSITLQERDALHAAIRVALDRSPLPEVPPAPPLPFPRAVANATGGAGLKPGEAWAASTDWDEILEPAGFTFSHRTGQEEYWVRPGKNRRDGHSVTVNYAGSDLMKVFSSSIQGLEPDATYTKFGAFAALFHGGDPKAAAKELAARGYGTRPVPTSSPIGTVALTGEVLEDEPAGFAFYTLDEFGLAKWLFDWLRTKPLYVYEAKAYQVWDGKAWGPDHGGYLFRQYEAMTEAMLAHFTAEDNEAMIKFLRSARSHAKAKNVIEHMRSRLGVTVSSSEMDPRRDLLNLDNTVLNMATGETSDHDPAYRMTRTFGARYNPEATCPRFLQFLEDVLPDPELRAYVQRATGYTAQGAADQRSMFLIYGPSGTGKTAFTKIISSVFGDYAGVAPSGTFKEGKDKGATADLHRLRGKRFVTTSETGEHTSFDEDLLKRLSGGDPISSRTLYRDFEDWLPECSIWIATNHPPRFSSDDDAIWRRAKMIPFLTQFGVGDRVEIPGLAASIVEEERDGILNWILEGLRDYLSGGLREPAQVREAAAAHRDSTDPVLRFFDELVADEMLVVEEDASMRANELHNMYLTWAGQNGEPRLGTRRFTNRLKSGRRDVVHDRKGGHTIWRGVRRAAGAGILGTIQPPLH